MVARLRLPRADRYRRRSDLKYRENHAEHHVASPARRVRSTHGSPSATFSSVIGARRTAHSEALPRA
jgi:hypothetical protein